MTLPLEPEETFSCYACGWDTTDTDEVYRCDSCGELYCDDCYSHSMDECYDCCRETCYNCGESVNRDEINFCTQCEEEYCDSCYGSEHCEGCEWEIVRQHILQYNNDKNRRIDDRKFMVYLREHHSSHNVVGYMNDDRDGWIEELVGEYTRSISSPENENPIIGKINWVVSR